jgi:hypothetical protein
MLECPTCHLKYGEESKFCRKCGVELYNPTDKLESCITLLKEGKTEPAKEVYDKFIAPSPDAAKMQISLANIYLVVSLNSGYKN